jgi:hypothetical protein
MLVAYAYSHCAVRQQAAAGTALLAAMPWQAGCLTFMQVLFDQMTRWHADLWDRP